MPLLILTEAQQQRGGMLPEGQLSHYQSDKSGRLPLTPSWRPAE